MAGCVFAYFAECTVVMPLFLLIAILRNVGVGMLRFAWAWPHKNKNKKFIVDPNTNRYIIQIHQINQ